MSMIAGRHNGRQIFLDVAIVSAEISHGGVVFGDPEPNSVYSDPVRALVDTGSTATSISPRTVQALDLRSGGKRDMMTANGPRRARAYDFRIGFFAPGAVGDMASFHVLRSPVTGVVMNSDNVPFDILLGMDVISQGDLVVRRDGSFNFEF